MFPLVPAFPGFSRLVPRKSRDKWVLHRYRHNCNVNMKENYYPFLYYYLEWFELTKMNFWFKNNIFRMFICKKWKIWWPNSQRKISINIIFFKLVLSKIIPTQNFKLLSLVKSVFNFNQSILSYIKIKITKTGFLVYYSL